MSVRPRCHGISPTIAGRLAHRLHLARLVPLSQINSMRYAVFGGCLESDLDFPSLPSAPHGQPATWRLRVSSAPAPPVALTALREEALSDRLTVQVARAGECVRVTYTDTGAYDLSSDGRTITWHRPEGADAADARLDVLGTMLGLAMHLRDRLTLHGSAVAVKDGALVFLAPSGYGKSTLAMSLTLAGARFMSDDAVPVRIDGDAVIAAPGVPSPRFREDSFARFSREPAGATAESSGKRSLGDRLTDDIVEPHERPLAAVYLLHPVSPAPGAEPRREVMAPTAATIAVLQNAKLAKVLWPDESPRLLGLVADVTRRVRVWRLDVPRDLEQLPALAEQLLEWHGAGVRDAASWR
jgi:hypothetical protein